SVHFARGPTPLIRLVLTLRVDRGVDEVGDLTLVLDVPLHAVGDAEAAAELADHVRGPGSEPRDATGCGREPANRRRADVARETPAVAHLVALAHEVRALLVGCQLGRVSPGHGRGPLADAKHVRLRALYSALLCPRRTFGNAGRLAGGAITLAN